MRLIHDTAGEVYGEILASKKPDLSFPVRALGNVTYSDKKGYFEIGRQKKVRTLTVNTVKSFAQTLRMMGLSKELIENNDFATKRDAYYQSKNWDEARFDEQTESDTVMDDIEALFSVRGVSREQLRFVPDEHGGAVAGQPRRARSRPRDRSASSGSTARASAPAPTRSPRRSSTSPSRPTRSSSSPSRPAASSSVSRATSSGRRQTASSSRWPGVPTRATRRFIRKLSDECRLPVYAFVDCDPYGISNIYRTLKVGSGNAAHLSQFFCVPHARYLGVTPQDIVEYQLPTHPLQDVDVKRAKDALKNDPFFQAHAPWRRAIDQLLKMGVRAEQQALAKWGLNYVIDEYLPRKLAHPEQFLP